MAKIYIQVNNSLQLFLQDDMKVRDVEHICTRKISGYI